MTVTLASEHIKAARKDHICSLCDRAIKAGEPYHRQRNLSDDGPYVWRNCSHCSALVRLIDFDYYGEGYTPDDVMEHDPSSVTEARWLIQWRRRWTRRDGALYPIPESAAPRPSRFTLPATNGACGCDA